MKTINKYTVIVYVVLLTCHYIYCTEWVVKIEGGPKVAEAVAREFGYIYKGKILGFENTYLLLKTKSADYQKRGFHPPEEIHKDERVVWADQQESKIRQKRDLLDTFIDFDSNQLPASFNDELWSQQWYLQDTRSGVDLPRLDLNVLPVYRMGITGRGIRVAILDDGLEYTHEDLWNNYDPDISWDVNDDEPDPSPRYGGASRNSHGTRCAGEVAMTANNYKCGVGIAFNARIGGIKLLDGPINDRIEGSAIGFGHELIDIYSASWGPSDDGRTIEGPRRLALEALERGVTKGRQGLGSIFVWASGNGGRHLDDCNCDGYVGSPYTVSVGSASQTGEFPWYGEACASIMAVTYSSGAYHDQMVATTDLKNRCTIKHSGTSASAPLAAGIIALTLEANPNLTWRDVQHMLVRTSEYAPLAKDKGWQMNAMGYRFNTRFGFGLINAFAMVQAAVNWTTVPPKTTCHIKSVDVANQTFYHNEQVKIKFIVTDTEMQKNEINFLEHVEVIINVNYSNRGSLEMFLTSPSGTRVQLLNRRKYDRSNNGFINWKLMSVMTWGEPVIGKWVLEIYDKVGNKNGYGLLGEFYLILHGTKEIPDYVGQGAGSYKL